MSKKWVTVDKKDIDLLTAVYFDIEGNPIRGELSSLIARLSKTQKKITTASAKAKARNLQQWVCRKISDITGIPYEQSDDSCDIHSREMGQAGVDIVLRNDAVKRFPFSIECKAVENLNLKDAVEQAKANVYKNTDWLLVHNKKAIAETLVTMSWDAFEKLVRRGGKNG